MIPLDFKAFKAVIFDMDGVLIDSMNHHVYSWQKVFKEMGILLPEEEIRRHEGEKAKVTIKRFAEQHGLTFSEAQLDEIIAKKRKIYRQKAPQGIRPPARALLDFVRRLGLKTAIVTGSVRTNLEWTLSVAERALFDVIVTAETCAQGKPLPDPYLRAASDLGIPPEQVLVIENAPLGIRSAKAAGMTCLALSTTLPSEELQEADYIIPDLHALGELNQLKTV